MDLYDIIQIKNKHKRMKALITFLAETTRKIKEWKEKEAEK